MEDSPVSNEQILFVETVAEVKILWARMCRADGINPASQFVVFSPTNPYATEYNAAVGRLQVLVGGAQ